MTATLTTPYHTWMKKVATICARRGISIAGDDKWFVGYFHKGLTPGKAVNRWVSDYAKWNGGGDP